MLTKEEYEKVTHTLVNVSTFVQSKFPAAEGSTCAFESTQVVVKILEASMWLKLAHETAKAENFTPKIDIRVNKDAQKEKEVSS